MILGTNEKEELWLRSMEVTRCWTCCQPVLMVM